MKRKQTTAAENWNILTDTLTDNLPTDVTPALREAIACAAHISNEYVERAACICRTAKSQFVMRQAVKIIGGVTAAVFAAAFFSGVLEKIFDSGIWLAFPAAIVLLLLLDTVRKMVGKRAYNYVTSPFPDIGDATSGNEKIAEIMRKKPSITAIVIAFGLDDDMFVVVSQDGKETVCSMAEAGIDLTDSKDGKWHFATKNGNLSLVEYPGLESVPVITFRAAGMEDAEKEEEI